MSATFLVTGFEPFRHHRVNPSWDALVQLEPELPKRVACRRLPVDHRKAHDQLARLVDDLRPVAVLCTGLAQGSTFRLERRARRPPELSSVAGAPELHGRWPWPLLNAALRRANVNVTQSFDAGRYVCESTYWSLLRWSAQASATPSPLLAAFVHVPHESEQYPVERTANAMRHIVQSTLEFLDSAVFPHTGRTTESPTNT